MASYKLCSIALLKHFGTGNALTYTIFPQDKRLKSMYQCITVTR